MFLLPCAFLIFFIYIIDLVLQNVTWGTVGHLKWGTVGQCPTVPHNDVEMCIIYIIFTLCTIDIIGYILYIIDII